MFIDRLLNQGNAPVLEQMLKFTAARHKLIAENIVNIDTPEYQQKDLSIDKFREQLRRRVESRQSAEAGSVGFDDLGFDVESPGRGMLFHDGSRKSMEYLQTEQAKNALMHNMTVELLRKQYGAIEMALKERVT